MSKEIITVKNLVKKYAEFTALKDISFSVKSGECLGLLGPNGAGKTTSVKIIQCISPYNSGEVQVNGIKAGLDARKIRATLGVVPQDNDLDNDLTVYQNLFIFAKFFDIPSRLGKQRIQELLKFVEMQDKTNSRIDELSGGMKRRVLLARALLNEPQIIIMDEPTTGLDPQARHDIWDKMRALKARGTTILLTTHYMEEAEKMCDRVLIMDKGLILRDDSPELLIKKEIGSGNLEQVFLKLTGRGIEA